MTGPAWLIDSKRIATKIKNASDTVDPKRARWISNPTKACPSCNYVIDNSDVVQEWPGLPRGVKFDPSDQELVWHLIAKAGKGGTRPHPFINEFIPTVDENDGICYTHPQKLPGVKQDGSVSHFFHRTFKAYNSGTRKRRKIQQNDDDKENTGGLAGDVRWHKTGKTKPVMIDGEHVGCKKIMVLYSVMKKGGKPEKTNWVMHQYHLGMGEDEKDGEFVVSKVFFQQQQQQLKSCANINDEGEELQLMRSDETLSEEATTIATTSAQVQPDVAYQAAASGSGICTTAPDSSICVPEHNPDDKQQLCEQITVDNEMMEDKGNVNQIQIQETVDEQDDNSHLTTEEDTKWWDGESQFLLDSQQLAEGLALCDEFLQSQSSCGGGGEETRRLKPCLLSEYARAGGVDDFKKDLEECQTLSLSHDVSEPNQQHTTDGLLDTPPDMRLSQLDFGSQDNLLS